MCVQFDCVPIKEYYTSVAVGLAADKAGLKEGDQLVSVNKQDISTLNHEALVAMIKQVSESKLIINFCKLILMEHLHT